MKEADVLLGKNQFIVYKPFKAGLPNLTRYTKDVWGRKDFILELANSELKAEYSTSFFGQIWIVLNPLMLAGIYYMLILLLSPSSTRGPEYFVHLLSGLFAFQFFTLAVSGSASSLIRLTGLISNLAFPRLVLPISSIFSAYKRFLPMMLVYTIFHLVYRQPISPATLLFLPAFVILFFFATGMGFLLATLQVYFRDTRTFLPYILRVWLYISPVLYVYKSIEGSRFSFLQWANPLFSIFSAWSSALTAGQSVDGKTWAIASTWAIATFLLGTFVFLTRERDFSVRL